MTTPGGAKKKRRTVKFCFVLSDEEKRRLEALAIDQGRSAAGVIRNIIRRAWDTSDDEAE